MESRCDQHVLEQLEGEEIRDYGRILLSMSNERFAKTPGSTCINNGGKNIRERIESIARFRKYPVGMGLVSVCVIIALTCSLVIGVQATSIPDSHKTDYWSLAKAKSSHCTTYAGAFDTYAKAVMKESINYRIMCASETEQKELIDKNSGTKWESGFSGLPDESESYYIFNLKLLDKDVYEGLLVIKLINEPDDIEWTEGMSYLAYQTIRVEKENGRWVAIPLSEFNYVATRHNLGRYGCIDLPATTYTDTVSDYKVEILFQTIYVVDNKVENTDDFSSIFGTSYSYSYVPKPNAEFSEAFDHHDTRLTHLGTQKERDQINKIGISIASVYPGQERPDELTPAVGCDSFSSSSSDGSSQAVRNVNAGWGPELSFSGGGGGGPFNGLLNINAPEYYVADLYINNELYTQMELHLQEEE